MHNQCSTTRSSSTDVCLRAVSRGTCYYPSRLAFHPYTQVFRMICTSIPVRSSTQFSPGFNLPRHRSMGFRSSTTDSGRTHPAPRRSCARVDFSTAPEINSLASPVIKTPKGIIQNARLDVAPPFGILAFYRPISLSPTGFRVFSSSRKGRFSTFTHATCSLSVSGRIQDWKFLPPIFTRDIQRTLLRQPSRDHMHCEYGALTLFGRAIPGRLPLHARR